MLSSYVRRSRAFSLVELRIVIAIIGVLVGLLLPAVQKAREAANRTRCTNNLHQIGMALHYNHDSYRTFPPGGIEFRPFGNSTRRQLAWSAFFLPYLEQENVYRSLDLSQPIDSRANALGGSSVIPTYFCPSKVRADNHYRGLGMIDYGGIFGQTLAGSNNPHNGTMDFDLPISLAMITDGASHTMVIAEDTQRDDGQWINALNLFDVAAPINGADPDDPDIHSEHPGGANALFADGSVHFLNENLAVPILAAIVTCAGGGAILDSF